MNDWTAQQVADAAGARLTAATPHQTARVPGPSA